MVFKEIKKVNAVDKPEEHKQDVGAESVKPHFDNKSKGTVMDKNNLIACGEILHTMVKRTSLKYAYEIIHCGIKLDLKDLNDEIIS